MKRILIVFPMGVEARAAFKKIGMRDNFPKEGDFLDKLKTKNGLQISMLVSGFGCKATRKRIIDAIEKTKPELVILSGCCGACHHNIKAGEMLGNAHGNTAKKMLEKLELRPSKFYTADHIVDELEKKSLSDNGYDAVEMESEIVHNELKIRFPEAEFLQIRTISDGLKTSLPMSFLNSIMNFETGRIEITKGKLLKNIIRNPMLIFTLPKFAAALAPVQKIYDRFIENRLLKEIDNL